MNILDKLSKLPRRLVSLTHLTIRTEAYKGGEYKACGGEQAIEGSNKLPYGIVVGRAG